jgi:hypothetical protein
MANKQISIENARIGFRNFTGKEGQFNNQGNRNFCVFLDVDTAKTLIEDGWNVRHLAPKNNEDEPVPYLQVSVKFDNYPPKIILISSKGKNIITEENANILDWAEIEAVDLVIRPYNWEVRGKGGVKAYLKSMYVTIVEDEFERKYNEVPDSATNTIGGCGNCDACDGGCKHHHID